MAILTRIYFIKVKASTFVEVMVALVILTCTFFIAAYFLAGMNSSGFNIQYRQAEDALQNYQYQTIQDKDFSNGVVESGSFKVEREIKQYGDSTNLIRLNFSVINKQQKVILTRAMLYRISANSE